ncbi:MAG: hypothetical protein NZ521_00785, partial [Flammeovirgaceae bacterium]|nr:hypothetical protein [Flammeovirgaceae bacterium]MDW8286621.1 hypothetical protein [Flammeovirgaceae bacterium]
MKYFLGLLIGLILMCVAVLLILSFAEVIAVPFYAWYLLLFHALLALVSFLIIRNGIHGDGLDFSNHLMAVSAVRLLSSAVMLFLYFYFSGKNLLNFLITFFAFYFIFTTYEL